MEHSVNLENLATAITKPQGHRQINNGFGHGLLFADKLLGKLPYCINCSISPCHNDSGWGVFITSEASEVSAVRVMAHKLTGDVSLVAGLESEFDQATYQVKDQKACPEIQFKLKDMDAYVNSVISFLAGKIDNKSIQDLAMMLAGKNAQPTLNSKTMRP